MKTGVGLLLTHFQALALFALLLSAVFGLLSRRPAMERLRYIAWSFLLFLLVAISVGWLMYPF